MDLASEYYKFGFRSNYQPVVTTKLRQRPHLGDLKGETALGIPLWMPTGFEIEGELFQLPNEPIITLSTQKKIVSTELAGNDGRGTVKEFISEGDWVINIDGLCIDQSKTGFPETQVALVNYIQEQKDIIVLKNYLTELNGIKQVIVQSFKWKRLIGTPYSIGYSLKLISDFEFDLIIK